MSTEVKINFINQSVNSDMPVIFVFTKNMVPTFDVLRHGIAWRVLDNVNKGSVSSFIFPIETSVQAMWGGYNKTEQLKSEIGKRYSVINSDGGIVLVKNGNASQKNAIEVNSQVHVDGGIQAQLFKDGRVMMTKNIVAYDQKATFILHPKLYWGIAHEIQEGSQLSTAVLSSDHFFEQDLEGVTETNVVLTGNAKDGYQFVIENQK